MMTRQAFSSMVIRVNFLLSFEAFLGGRPTTVTRGQIVAWQANCTNKKGFRDTMIGHQNTHLPENTKGPLGKTLQWPSWLTNFGHYNSARGSYTVPWNLIDDYNAEIARRAKEKADAELAAQQYAGTIKAAVSVAPPRTNSPAPVGTASSGNEQENS